MEIILFIITFLLAYLIGAIPFGLLIVKLWNGKDIRYIQSGRTGGTNAMRAAGFWAGLLTAIFDILKGAVSVWIARSLFSDNYLVEILAGLFAILGHNYSIYLVRRDENRRIVWRGGAGGAPTVGGALAIWPPSLLIIVPTAALILFGIGYASLATMSIPIIALVIFSIRAGIGDSHWIYVVYAIFAEIILIWALRPNIKRLMNGTERIVGWRARKIVKGNQTTTTESTNALKKT
jgi:glycerol-3-phosphate acyltransferase PlsY